MLELICKTVLLHGQQKIKILTPARLEHDTTLVTDGKGFYALISNGTGYSALSELFALGISLGRDEVLYLPFEFGHMHTYQIDFPDERHSAGLFLANYCTSRFQARDLVSSVKVKSYQKDKIERTCPFSKEDVDLWKTRHRTTVKEYKSFIIISTNADGFTSFAQSCNYLAGFGNDAERNKCPPHMHHDWDENTYKSLGITLYYWQSPESSVIGV